MTLTWTWSLCHMVCMFNDTVTDMTTVLITNLRAVSNGASTLHCQMPHTQADVDVIREPKWGDG